MPQDRKGKSSNRDLVTASEIAAFVYCPESWRLEELRLPAQNQAAMDAGTRHHVHKAIAERVSGVFIGIGRWLVATAVIVSLLSWLLWR